ncbi:MAG: hypothetical protein AAFQ74_05010 [Cyanobacteria bacterium J06623_4]
MAATQPLKGIALIDCAKANATQGAAIAARLCGYEGNISGFQQALKKAGEDMGVELTDLEDLITDQFVAKQNSILEVAPDSPQNL